jgi:hypothetical protein
MANNGGEKRCSWGGRGGGGSSDATIQGGRVNGWKNGRKVNIFKKNFFLSTNFKLLNHAKGM